MRNQDKTQKKVGEITKWKIAVPVRRVGDRGKEREEGNGQSLKDRTTKLIVSNQSLQLEEAYSHLWESERGKAQRSEKKEITQATAKAGGSMA